MPLTREALLVTYVRAWPSIQYRTERKARLAWAQEIPSSNLGAPTTCFFLLNEQLNGVGDRPQLVHLSLPSEHVESPR
jgi:hypothetical protein